MLGNFNCEEVMWELLEAQEGVRDKSRYREKDEPSKLDIVFKKGKEVRVMSPLGKSDHVTLEMDVMGEVEAAEESTREAGGIIKGQTLLTLKDFLGKKIVRI